MLGVGGGSSGTISWGTDIFSNLKRPIVCWCLSLIVLGVVLWKEMMSSLQWLLSMMSFYIVTCLTVRVLHGETQIYSDSLGISQVVPVWTLVTGKEIFFTICVFLLSNPVEPGLDAGGMWVVGISCLSKIVVNSLRNILSCKNFASVLFMI